MKHVSKVYEFQKTQLAYLRSTARERAAWNQAIDVKKAERNLRRGR